MSSKINWLKLKNDYIYDKRGSVASFLRENNIQPNGNTSRRTKGWNKERDNYLSEVESLTRIRTIEQTVETETQIRTRQAEAARKLQDIGMKEMEKLKPESLQEARRMIVDGLREEREALGMNIKTYGRKKQSNLNMTIMGTRYGERLSKMELPELIKEFDSLANK